MEQQTFEKLGLKEELCKVTQKLYFKKPTKIQSEAIPEILKGNSIIGKSQTGSGKTHAYLLPLLNKINVSKRQVQVVITTPTRELAIQINEEIKKLIEYANKKDIWVSKLLIGGTDRERMIKQLANPPHIIIGTPGRIADMVKSGAVSIYTAKSMVMDEADLMVEMKFMETMDEILVKCHPSIQILVFSATIPAPLKVFFKKYLEQPIQIEIEESFSPDLMNHHLIAIKHQDIVKKVLDLSQVIQPYVALIFVNSKESADELGMELRGKGLNIGVLHGGLSSRERTRTVKDIFDLKYQYIVATDLASRGIDIKGASHVINVDLPKEIEFYIHRVGRTARAGLEGTAISFYKEEDIALIEMLEKKGIHFQYTDIKQGEFIPAKRYNKRSKRSQVQTSLDKEAWKRVKKKKKVKPGYKKKMKREQEKIKRRLKNKRK